jgi:glycosyltransferase involved in cell wall biosynthesis
MRRVIIIQELLAQYRKAFYEQLRGELRNRGTDLDLVHGRATGARAAQSDEIRLPWSRIVTNRRLRLGPLGTGIWQPALRIARQSDLVVVEHANRQLLNYLLLGARATRRGPIVAFWGHGANLQAANSAAPQERLKRWTANKPDWWFAYTKGSAARVEHAGFPPDRITVVQNSIDTSVYRKTTVERSPKRCVYVGGLHKYKRIDFLLEAAKETARRIPDFQLVIVGDGEERALVANAARQYQWLDYRGALFDVEKARATASSSLMLMPGLVGLGVVDAFAAQTPIVTTDIPWHSPEFEYIAPGENGDVLPANTTPVRFGARVAELLGDEAGMAALRAGCADSASRYTVEAMVANFSAGVIHALEAGTRRRSQ